jgi:predicted nucleotidyltransferase
MFKLTTKFGLTDIEISSIKKIIKAYIRQPGVKAFIFGSRAHKSAAKWSDIDIGLDGDPLSLETFNALLEAFEESDLPYKVDLVAFQHVSEEFKKIAYTSIIPLNFDL